MQVVAREFHMQYRMALLRGVGPRGFVLLNDRTWVIGDEARSGHVRLGLAALEQQSNRAAAEVQAGAPPSSSGWLGPAMLVGRAALRSRRGETELHRIDDLTYLNLARHALSACFDI